MKTKQEAIAYAMTFKDVYEDMPFKGSDMVCIRLRKTKKVFAWIFEREGHTWINLKCSPELRELYRGAYESVVPAYHLNKEHWNSVILDGTVPEKELKRMVAESYELVCS